MKNWVQKVRDHKAQVAYCARFLGLFCALYYTTEAVIGLSSPEGGYNAFVAQRLNFVDPFRRFLLSSTQSLLSAAGYRTYFRDSFALGFAGGGGIRVVYSCLGYGLLSFWAAFVFANPGGWKRKAMWTLGGCLALIGVNILRLSLVLLAVSKGWPMPLGVDHHTWFNVVAYLLIFLMIYCFDRSRRRSHTPKEKRVKTAREERGPVHENRPAAAEA